MKLVVDTNRLIAALIRDSACRKILISKEFIFLTPDFTLTEIEKHKRLILEKSSLSINDFEAVLSVLLERLDVKPLKEYKSYLSKASKMINDVNDVPFLALALAAKAEGVWTEDADFEKQNLVKIYSTKDLLEKI
jgi:predicted nucleic acid-binding protein